MKKSLKRISAMIFAVALVISLVPTTMAVDGTEDDEFSEFLTNVNSNTIYFEETDSSEDNLAVASATDADEEQWDKQQRADAKRHNEEVIQKAKEYVWSLDLQSKGLGFIENSCIEELESYEGMDDGQILSYTVYTPKSDSPSIDDLTYLGTHQARKFYTYFPSSMETKSNIKKDTRSTLQKWADQVVSCFLVFQSVEVNAGWYVFQNMMGAPKDYTVKSAAFTESYCNLNIHTRGVYTQYGNGDYDMVTSQQYAETYPYMIFHPVDSPDYKEYYGKRFGYSGNVYSRKYKNSASKLCEEAWQVFYGSLVADKFDTVNIRSFKTVWPEK